MLQLDTTVKCSLTTECEEDTIWLFLLNDMDDVFWCDWEVENLIGKEMAGLNGCNVWVKKYCMHIGFFQRFDGLRTYNFPSIRSLFLASIPQIAMEWSSPYLSNRILQLVRY